MKNYEKILYTFIIIISGANYFRNFFKNPLNGWGMALILVLICLILENDIKLLKLELEKLWKDNNKK